MPVWSTVVVNLGYHCTSVDVTGSSLRYEVFHSQRTPTVESAGYSVGRHNSTRVNERRNIGLKKYSDKKARHVPQWEGGRRACYVTPDLSYVQKGEEGKQKGEDNKRDGEN